MIALLTVAVLSLMVPLRMQTHFALVRPFEFIVAAGMMGWPLIAARRGVRASAGVVLLLPYFAWHVVSAELGGGLHNAAREGVQVAVVTTFAFLLAQEAPRIDPRSLSRRLLWGMVAIAAGTIVWHVSHGYLVGWKRITDPRLTFVFLPPLLAGIILFTDPRRRRGLWIAWACLLPLLLMSGERKALVIYLLMTALLVARGRFALALPAIAGAFVALFVISTVIDNAYLQRQIHTIVDPSGTGNYQYVIATGQYLPGETQSDVQRAFALHVSTVLFKRHPLLGVGTNQYVDAVNELYPSEVYPNMPDQMKLGIHGEFERILTENGLIGLTLYLLVWAVSWIRLSRLLGHAFRDGLLTRMQARILPLLFFIPFPIYLGTEAPGTRAFVGVIVISLLPELACGALAESTQRVTSPLTIRGRRAAPMFAGSEA